MNKYWTITIFIIVFTGSIKAQNTFLNNLKSLNVTKDSIIQIDFFYLPWELRAYKCIDEKGVRDYCGLTSFYSILDYKIIEVFEESLNIFNFYKIEKTKKNSRIDVRMVIDFYFKSGKKNTFLVSSKGLYFQYDGNCFWGNNHFMKNILEYVPEAEIKI